MRVVHVLQGLHAAGIEHLALQLINHAPAGVENSVLNLDALAQDLRPAFERQLSTQKLRAIIDCSPCDGPWLALYCWRLFCRQRPAALVLYPFSRPMLWVALAARLAGVRRLRVHVGNAAPQQAPQRRRWLQLLLWFQRLGVVALPCSQAVATSFMPLPPGLRLGAVVANGCDLEAIASRAATAAPLRSGPQKRLLMVARLDPIKDQATLVRAFALAWQPGWQLQLVGEGPNRSALEQLILELHLESVVQCLGRREDVPELLGAADLFAFATTDSEGFGIALVEAMAAGLPVIASDVPACREVLADGGAGELVPAGDVQAWAERLQWLMHEPAQRQRLAAAARQRSEAYGMAECARRWYAELGR